MNRVGMGKEERYQAPERRRPSARGGCRERRAGREWTRWRERPPQRRRRRRRSPPARPAGSPYHGRTGGVGLKW